MFETIFTTTDNTISISSTMIALVAAVIIGVVIAAAYMLASKRKGTTESLS